MSHLITTAYSSLSSYIDRHPPMRSSLLLCAGAIPVTIGIVVLIGHPRPLAATATYTTVCAAACAICVLATPIFDKYCGPNTGKNLGLTLISYFVISDIGMHSCRLFIDIVPPSLTIYRLVTKQ